MIMEKIKIAIYPHFFERQNLITALDPNKFEKFLIPSANSILRSSLDAHLRAFKAKIWNGEKIDIFFVQLEDLHELLFLEDWHVVKIGFEMTYLWNQSYTDLESLYKTLDQFDVICGWMEHFLNAALSLNKELWTFGDIFNSNFPIIPFSEARQKLDFHGINLFSSEYYSTSIPFVERIFRQSPNLKYWLTINEKREYILHQISRWIRHVKGHQFYNNKNDYLDFLVNNCSAMFQFYVQPSFGRAIIDAVQIGIPSIASPFWYQQLFFPDLIVHNLQQAENLISRDYKYFKTHVERAQSVFRSRLLGTCNNEYNDYIMKLFETYRK